MSLGFLDSKYKFEFEDMEFSKDGGLDELISLDRYAIPAYDNYQVGDTVVFIYDSKGSKRVGKITQLADFDIAYVEDRFGETHTVELEMMHKPLETRPAQLWDRWSKGGASVESTSRKQQYWENEFRWLHDGFRYSLGGRIQLMLGQEFVTGVKANLTAYNCYVSMSPEPSTDPRTQFINVIESARYQAHISRRGGGDGINITPINTVVGSRATKTDFIFYLPEDHKDYQELLDRQLLGKFKNVEVVTTRKEYNRAMVRSDKRVTMFKALDDVDGLFDNLVLMVNESYDGRVVAIDFSDLRHRNAIVKGVNGRSSGAVSWMELFDLVAQLLQQEVIDCVEFAEIFSFIVHLIQQGGSRRGALMLILAITSKLVEKFIKRKREMGYLSGANISVGIDDTSMEKILKVKKGNLSKSLISMETIDAVRIWDMIVESAWKSAEPGIVFLERCNKESNSWYFSELVCTNPCGIYEKNSF